MKTETFIEMLEKAPELKKDLFIRGFLITSRRCQLNDFPFYGVWRSVEYQGFYFIAHPLTNVSFYEKDDRLFFLLGHAYDPIAMIAEEKLILERLAEAYGTEAYQERVDDLTGVFVYGTAADGRIEYLVDPSGMQSAYCGVVDGAFYLSSHAQLIGDVCGLQMDPFIAQLTQYRWYGRVMGPYLPGDLTPFAAVKRVVPDIAYRYEDRITHRRFWPLNDVRRADTPQEYEAVIRQGADILRRNMQLVAQKWTSPWISLTGGIDSNTTFAAANGLYEHFGTFSYISDEKEIPDADAAKQIAERFRMAHHVYQIPEKDADIPLFNERRELLRHNNGYVAELYDYEARKKLWLHDHVGCDVEVKSWVSETIRGYWFKHYGRRHMPGLSPKLFRNLYKIFIQDRSLAHRLDALFADYIREYEYEKIPQGYPAADMHFHEMTWGSWGGLNITEMKYYTDLTIIYNNRRFLDLMFRVPLEKRISDQHHLDMKRYLNHELADMNIRVVNLHETRLRAFLLNVIFTINMYLPF